MSARFLLRDETRAAHEALDAHFSRLDLSDEADYRAFLTAHAAAFIPVEQALEKAGAGEIFPQWPAMRRGHLLREDLAELGRVLPPADSAPVIDTQAEIVGALYVLEGSRLGGNVLRGQVGKDFPIRFLSQNAALRWPDFVTEIERMLEGDVDRSQAVASANRIFDYFLRAALADDSGGA